MDIDLLAKMVKEAILDHDTVTMPGVGCFVAELVPSTFSDKGYTINPPYRRLFFSPKQGGDTYLADLYTRDNKEVNGEMATRILTEFLTEMKEVLKVRKTVVFPGLGRLRATRENHFFFVADEDLDIYPEGLGLAPLSLKTHVETPEEVATAVAGLAELISEPEPEPVEEIPEQVGKDEEVPVENSEKEPEAIVVPEPANEPEPIPEPEPVQEPEPVKEPEPIVVPQSAKEPESIPEPAPVPEPEPIVVHEPVKEPEPIVVPEPVPEPLMEQVPEKKKSRKWLKVLLIVLAVIVALLVLLAIIGRVAPGLLDPLLYSKEELQILRY